ncbi:MAG: phospholipid scramblase-related protein, partial [Actinomycetota bacterium]
MAKAPPADWYADPFGRFEARYWDGKAWTSNVLMKGKPALDEPDQTPVVPSPDRSKAKVQRDVAKAGAQAAAGPGGGTPLTEHVLVVNQKAKILELTNEYAVFDKDGNQIGAVRQVGQSTTRKLLRAFTSVDQFLTTRLEVVDAAGSVILKLTRPGKIMKSRVIVEDANGQEVGQILQQNVIGKIRFALEANGQPLGSINAENWRAWNFNIQDQSGTEVARITKTW